QYHEKYYKEKPFILEKAIDELPVPVKELESPITRNFILNALKRGNRQQVILFNKGLEETGYLMVNAKAGQVNTYDSSMQPIQEKTKEQKTKKTQGKSTQSQHEEIKKKAEINPGPNRKQKRGHSMKI